MQVSAASPEGLDLQGVFARLGVALALGLLVGIQRQRTDARLAGFRTFPLVTLLGGLCALVAQSLGPWVLSAGLIALAATIAVGNSQTPPAPRDAAPGITTEVALLVMFLVGAASITHELEISIVLGGLVAVLLQFKEEMHGLARRLEENDILAVMRFVLIALVVLPVLPNRDFGPFDVLNLREIWWMVVLIVGIGLASYIALRIFGARAGTLLAGIFGGLISSTATTATYSRRTRGNAKACALAAVVILIASCVLYARVLVEVVAVAPSAIAELAPPLAVLFAVFVALCAIAWFRRGSEAAHAPLPEDPAELRPALYFALAYAAILLAVAAARHHFATDRALYVVAGLSGLTDVDAITLSTARMVEGGRLGVDTGWRLIVVASLSNLAFKVGIVVALGDPGLLRRIALWFGIGFGAACALLVLWP
jgi:uncharacterized membrane protein (DUF4010 family)